MFFLSLPSFPTPYFLNIFPQSCLCFLVSVSGVITGVEGKTKKNGACKVYTVYQCVCVCVCVYVPASSRHLLSPNPLFYVAPLSERSIKITHTQTHSHTHTQTHTIAMLLCARTQGFSHNAGEWWIWSNFSVVHFFVCLCVCERDINRLGDKCKAARCGPALGQKQTKKNYKIIVKIKKMYCTNGFPSLPFPP